MATNCLYRPRAPTPTMNPIPPSCGPTTNVLPCGTVGVKKDCGFPWWVVFLLLGLIVLGLVWACLKNRNVNNPPVVINNPTLDINGNSAASSIGTATAGGTGYVAYQHGQKKIKQGSSQTIRTCSSNGTAALFMFTVNGCTWCDKTKPQLEAAANCLNIEIYEVNRLNLEKQDYPKGYPFIFLLTPEGKRIPFQNMKRCAKNLVEFVSDNLGSNVVNQDCYNKLPSDCSA